MKAFVVIAALLLSISAFACGGSDDTAEDSSGPTDGPITSNAIVPNTFLTYERKPYRLVEVLQADLVDEREFQKVGSSQEADIEFVGSLDVYERRGDSQAVYTLTKASGSGETALPATWLRWKADE